MEFVERYDFWLKNARDESVRALLNEMADNGNRKQGCFSGDLAFGTAGMRAIMDAGTNRMNVYTVARASQGVSEYLKKNFGKVVTVAFDSRNNSELFAKTAAAVFAANGMKVYLTGKLQPSPVLSYITRYYNADCGIMITASHNSKEYNGYKVYSRDGAQITDATANSILKEINNTDIFKVKFDCFDEYLAKGQIAYMSGAVMKTYVDKVLAQSLGSADGITIAYTPLNGTGYRVVPEVLEKIGAKVVKVVEQAFPNGSFTTCAAPNPEKDEALALGLTYAEANGAQLLIATDPDCDRVGVAVKHDGKYVHLSGNEIGILLTDFCLAVKKARGILPKKPVVIKTIVTSDLVDKIVADYGGTTVNLLTGFKYIGEYITKMERENSLGSFVLGFEESCGYLAGSYVRDKDGVVASMLIAEMTAEYAKRGVTLVDRLNALYRKYGHYVHRQITFKFDGVNANEKMKSLMKKLREFPVGYVGGLKALNKIDLLGDDLPELPRSDVLIYALDGDAKMIVRPSGTEPLIKLYLSAVGESGVVNLIFGQIEKCTAEFFEMK